MRLKPFQKNKSLSELSTFGIGGEARLFTEVFTIEELQRVIAHCHENALPFHIVGKGSNSLFDDKGFDGLVILNKIIFLEIENCVVDVGGGYSFSLLGIKTARKGLGGLAFAAGIPASVGGAIFMNAGANGSETCDALREVTFIDEKGQLHTLLREEIAFSYRYSAFHEKKGVIASAKFHLSEDPTARKKQLEIIEYRTDTQPYGDKSCGCIFRNPTGESAGALIEKCGLKGTRIGGAEVSKLHGNFIVNKADARAEDVLKLATHVKGCIKEKTGIELEMELRVIPNQK